MVPFSARALLLLIGATFVPRIILAFALGVAGNPESWEYDVIASNILRGAGHVYEREGFVYAAYSPPLWSFILAGLLGLAGGARSAIQILQALLCLGAAMVFGGLAQRISGDEKAGLVTAFAVALQPSLLYYSVVKSDPLPLNVFLLGLILVSACGLLARPGASRAAIFGLLVGLSVLSRGTPVVALPLVLMALAIRWRQTALKPVSVALIVFALGLAPWLVRNQSILGTPLITSTAGENFWNGNHEGSFRRTVESEGRRVTHVAPSNSFLPDTVRRVLATGSEADRNDVFMAEAWRFIRAHPGAALTLFARKVRTFWWRIDSDPRDYPPAASVTYEVIYGIELSLGLFGALALFRTPDRERRGEDLPAAALALGLMLSISLLQSAFYVQGRHRFMIEPVLLIFTALGAVRLGQLARGQHRE